MLNVIGETSASRRVISLTILSPKEILSSCNLNSIPFNGISTNKNERQLKSYNNNNIE
jgi:hypothetical protein